MKIVFFCQIAITKMPRSGKSYLYDIIAYVINWVLQFIRQKKYLSSNNFAILPGP